jgi:hypothetical protein
MPAPDRHEAVHSVGRRRPGADRDTDRVDAIRARTVDSALARLRPRRRPRSHRLRDLACGRVVVVPDARDGDAWSNRLQGEDASSKADGRTHVHCSDDPNRPNRAHADRGPTTRARRGTSSRRRSPGTRAYRRSSAATGRAGCRRAMSSDARAWRCPFLLRERPPV